MFRLIKQFLSRPEEPKEITLSAEELESWLEKEIENRAEAFKEEAENVNSQVEETSDEAFTMLDELEEKELQNENIPVKEKHYMEGNRATFVKSTREFLKTIPLFKNPYKFEEDFQELKSKLNHLNHQNQRAYSILQHFFANETKKITQKIKDIENRAKSLDEHYKELGLPGLNSIKQVMEEEEKKASANESVLSNLKEKQAEYNDLKQRLALTEKKISEIQNMNEYSEYLEINKQKDQIVDEINKQRERIDSLLSNLGQALKKNQRIALQEKLNQQMLDSPWKAFSENDSKTILDFLQKLRQNINKGTIELKDKKKEKSISTIDQVDKDLIENFNSKHSKLQDERKRLETKLRHSQVVMEHTELIYKRDHIKNKIDKAAAELNQIQSKATKTPAKDKKEFVEKINQSLPDKKIILQD